MGCGGSIYGLGAPCSGHAHRGSTRPAWLGFMAGLGSDSGWLAGFRSSERREGEGELGSWAEGKEIGPWLAEVFSLSFLTLLKCKLNSTWNSN